MKIPDNAPWWAWIVVLCAFIGSGFVAYSQIFPNPAVTSLHEEFKVHEASPAHGIGEIKKELQQIYVTQQVILDDMSEFEDEQKEQTTLLYEIKRNTQ